jgi:hypothetical protein
MPFPSADSFPNLDPQYLEQHQAAKRWKPEDILEPEPNDANLYREVSIKFMAKMIGALEFLKKSKDTAEQNMRLDILAAIFSLRPHNDDAFSDIASKHNRTRAAVSAQAQSFLRANDLPPIFGQKSKAASAAYSRKRLERLSA